VEATPLGRGARDFLGNLYNKTELTIILKMLKVCCVTSCISFRNTTLLATRSLRSIKSRHIQQLFVLDFWQHCSLLPAFRVALSASPPPPASVPTMHVPCDCTYICNWTFSLRPAVVLSRHFAMLVRCQSLATRTSFVMIY